MSIDEALPPPTLLLLSLLQQYKNISATIVYNKQRMCMCMCKVLMCAFIARGCTDDER